MLKLFAIAPGTTIEFRDAEEDLGATLRGIGTGGHTFELRLCQDALLRLFDALIEAGFRNAPREG